MGEESSASPGKDRGGRDISARTEPLSYPFLSIAVFQIIHMVLLPLYPQVKEGAGPEAFLCVDSEIYYKGSQGLHET